MDVEQRRVIGGRGMGVLVRRRDAEEEEHARHGLGEDREILRAHDGIDLAHVLTAHAVAQAPRAPLRQRRIVVGHQKHDHDQLVHELPLAQD